MATRRSSSRRRVSSAKELQPLPLLPVPEQELAPSSVVDAPPESSFPTDVAPIPVPTPEPVDAAPSVIPKPSTGGDVKKYVAVGVQQPRLAHATRPRYFLVDRWAPVEFGGPLGTTFIIVGETLRCAISPPPVVIRVGDHDHVIL